MATSTAIQETETVNAKLQVVREQTQKAAEAASTSTGKAEVSYGKQWWRADEAMTISATVLVFGVLVMVLMTVVLRKSNIQPDAVLRLFGTTIIIIGALFLIVAGYTETQMGPVMGLLGTIAGYLLGKNSNTTGTGGKSDV